jgi:hypothetical protein
VVTEFGVEWFHASKQPRQCGINKEELSSSRDSALADGME